MPYAQPEEGYLGGYPGNEKHEFSTIIEAMAHCNANTLCKGITAVPKGNSKWSLRSGNSLAPSFSETSKLLVQRGFDNDMIDGIDKEGKCACYRSAVWDLDKIKGHPECIDYKCMKPNAYKHGKDRPTCNINIVDCSQQVLLNDFERAQLEDVKLTANCKMEQAPDSKSTSDSKSESINVPTTLQDFPACKDATPSCVHATGHQIGGVHYRVKGKCYKAVGVVGEKGCIGCLENISQGADPKKYEGHFETVACDLPTTLQDFPACKDATPSCVHATGHQIGGVHYRVKGKCYKAVGAVGHKGCIGCLENISQGADPKTYKVHFETVACDDENQIADDIKGKVGDNVVVIGVIVGVVVITAILLILIFVMRRRKAAADKK